MAAARDYSLPPTKNLSKFWVNPKQPERMTLQGEMGITDTSVLKLYIDKWRVCAIVHLDIFKTYNDNRVMDQHDYLSAAEYAVPELKKYQCRWPAEQFARMFCSWAERAKECAINAVNEKMGSLLQKIKDRKKTVETARAEAARRKHARRSNSPPVAKKANVYRFATASGTSRSESQEPLATRVTRTRANAQEARARTGLAHNSRHTSTHESRTAGEDEASAPARNAHDGDDGPATVATVAGGGEDEIDKFLHIAGLDGREGLRSGLKSRGVVDGQTLVALAKLPESVQLDFLTESVRRKQMSDLEAACIRYHLGRLKHRVE